MKVNASLQRSLLLTVCLPPVLLFASPCASVDAARESKNQLSNSAVAPSHADPAPLQAEWGTAKNGLRCSLAIQERTWAKGRGVVVLIALENTSGQKISFKALPFLVLSREYLAESGTPTLVELQRNEYWCPIDISRNGSALRANEYPTIVLETGESRSLRVDASKLGWNVVKGSTWPDRGLFAVVPPASYRLYFQVDIWDVKFEGMKRDNTTSVPRPSATTSVLSRDVVIVVNKP
jgi:hypothetical protein